MNTLHKRKAGRIGEIIAGVEYRRKFFPDRPDDELEMITTRVLDEAIRLGELAYKGFVIQKSHLDFLEGNR